VANGPGGQWAFVVEADAGKSWLQAVNLHLMRTEKRPKAGTALELPAEVRGITISESGQRLYLPYSGGVVVVEVDETDCGALLDGGDCPGCIDSDCLTLATIESWRPGARLIEKGDATGQPEAGTAWIDNEKGRVILPSTQAIAAALRCLMEHGPKGSAETQGPPGADGTDGAGIDDVSATFVHCALPGSAQIQPIGGRRILALEIPRGCDGLNGTDGVGLEADLVQIKSLSWSHRHNGSLIPVEMPDKSIRRGVAIEFSRKVIVSLPGSPGSVPNEIDADHVFQLLVREQGQDSVLVICRCPLAGGLVLPATVTGTDPAGIITSAKVETSGPAAAAAVYIISDLALGRLQGQELWVVLRGDFVREAIPVRGPDGAVTVTAGRAIDAEFVRGELPTGDRPAGSIFGVQGGMFESWFTVGDVR
jgi:hypothetical protein